MANGFELPRQYGPGGGDRHPSGSDDAALINLLRNDLQLHEHAVQRETVDRTRNNQAIDIDKQTVALGERITAADNAYLTGQIDQSSLVQLHKEFGQLVIVDRKGDVQAIADDANFIKGDQAIVDSQQKILKDVRMDDAEKRLREGDIAAHEKSRDNSSADIPKEMSYIRADDADLRINAEIETATRITPELIQRDIASKQKIIEMRKQDIADEPDYNRDNSKAIELDKKVMDADSARIKAISGRN